MKLLYTYNILNLSSLLAQLHFDFNYFIALQSLEWRKRWDVDKLPDWEMPQFLKDYLPHGISGFDKDGAPGKFYRRNYILCHTFNHF